MLGLTVVGGPCAFLQQATFRHTAVRSSHGRHLWFTGAGDPFRGPTPPIEESCRASAPAGHRRSLTSPSPTPGSQRGPPRGERGGPGGLRGRTSLGATFFRILATCAEQIGAAGGRLYVSSLEADMAALRARTVPVTAEPPNRPFGATPVLGEATWSAVHEARAWVVRSKN